MNFLELKIIRQFGASIIYFTSLLVFGLGLWLWVSVSTPPAGHRDLASLASPSREPSSLKTDGGAVDPVNFDTPKADAHVETKVETFLLDCFHDGARVELKSVARQVRLKTGTCPGHKVNLDESNIVNHANGFEATLFQLEQGGFSSDYINLVDGQNQIVVQLTDSRGQRISANVIISRQPTL
jgi:hypothetical protein